MNLFLIAVAVIVACAVLNRVRGGGFYGDKLPGRALLWVTPAIGGLAALLYDWKVAVAFALGYLFWGLWAWGYALTQLAGIQSTRAPTPFEAVLKVVGQAPMQTFARMLFVLPGVVAVSYLLGNWWFALAAPAFAAAATAAYVAFFRPLGTLDWTRAEIATGALWGLLILSARAFA